ncbi:hypothetical protein PybrP1_000469 [[Pythium] brassicae (nom. inval.)]|nr:hypothetical protein PybrP1_000469 [[Pythium] brassicae (nom. inval.)]
MYANKVITGSACTCMWPVLLREDPLIRFYDSYNVYRDPTCSPFTGSRPILDGGVIGTGDFNHLEEQRQAYRAQADASRASRMLTLGGWNFYRSRLVEAENESLGLKNIALSEAPARVVVQEGEGMELLGDVNSATDDWSESFFTAETPDDLGNGHLPPTDGSFHAHTAPASPLRASTGESAVHETATSETAAAAAPSVKYEEDDEASDPEAEPPPNSVMVMGYSVDFPQGKRPFPAQLAVMNSVLQALKSGQHALLESPTGSGKTLALLCSTLTFQRHHATELMREAEQQRRAAAAAHAATVEQRRQAVEQVMSELAQMRDSLLASSWASEALSGAAASSLGSGDVKDEFEAARAALDRPLFPPLADSQLTDSKEGVLKREHSACTASDENSDELPDLQPLQLQRALSGSLLVAEAAVAVDTEAPPVAGPRDEDAAAEQRAGRDAASEEQKAASARGVAPKIFFCSRTHSQLSQAVGELKNCPASYTSGPSARNPFADELRMCVLGAKPRFCVNEAATADPGGVADTCRELLFAGACKFATKRRDTNDLKRVTPPVWDIEDMVALSRKYGECGYFHAREAVQDAHIVFCPYVYVLDPGIRAAANISLRNAVVIFDEAHNVEDTCRASASLELPARTLEAAVGVFAQHLQYVHRPPPYHRLLDVLRGLDRWVFGVSANAATVLRPTGDDEESRVWTGAEALVMLAEFTGITQRSFADVKADLAAVEDHEKELASKGGRLQDARDDQVAAAAAARESRELLSLLPLGILRSLVHVVDYMLREELKYLDDFKLVVQRTRVAVAPAASQRAQAKAITDDDDDEWELKMCIWCLSARVAFSDVARAARSVLLTSGTLSPMGSFAGELGATFPIRLEANHVVDMHKQVFAGAVMRGPGGVDLSSTYAKQQETRYQDSMGQLLLRYAHVVPGGVLMFFPSYALLEKLLERWRTTGLLREIDAVKEVFSEPRQAGKEFDALLERYKTSVASGRACTAGARTGAVFLAVYRGKVSEGIDFSNDNARAVLAVGIPLPNFKDLQVALKRKYQDEKSRVDRTLVNGKTWYKLQAFRALNQALGRCIRHRADYGTILLLDSRHRDGENTRSLSKWMRPFVQEVEQAELVLTHFIDFFKRNEQELGTGAPAMVPPSRAVETTARSRLPLQLQGAC